MSIANRFFCAPVWMDPDTEFNDQASETFEGLSALSDLRRQGFLPQEEPEHVFSEEEVWS